MAFHVERVGQLTGHAAAVYALAPGRGPSRIFSGSADNMVAEWSLADMAVQPLSIRLEHTVYALCPIPEKGQLLVGTSAGSLHAIDLTAQREIRHLAYHNQGLFDVVYAAPLEQIYALSADGSLSVWDAREFSLLQHIPLCEKKLRQAAWHEETRHLAVATGDGLTRIFSTDNMHVAHALPGHTGSVNAMAFHPTKPLLVTGGHDAHLRFWNTEDAYQAAGAIPAHNFAIYSIVFSPDGRFCATASRDKTVKIWDANSFELIARLDLRGYRGHTHSVNKALWVTHQNYLVTTGDDRTLIVWQVTET